jgi:hypothetical protein
MATAFFSSLPSGDVVEVDLIGPDGRTARKTLFVDSGFTGQSALILSPVEQSLCHAAAPSSIAGGALQGAQMRGLVVCRVPGLTLQKVAIAIFTDLSSLALPSGVEGMVGLSFLRHFRRWGAEQTDAGDWRFFLSDG